MNWKLAMMCAVGGAVLSQAAYSEQPGHPKRAGLPTKEAMVLGLIHQANQNEIALANLALQNASSEKVKGYANQMISDHTQTDQQVLAFADSHNVQVPTAAQLKSARAERKEARATDDNYSKAIGSVDGEYNYYDVGTGGSGPAPSFKATMDRLQGLKGADFDRAYMSAVVDDHQYVADRLTKSRFRIKDPAELKLVDQVLSTVNSHLTAAKQLSASLSS